MSEVVTVKERQARAAGRRRAAAEAVIADLRASAAGRGRFLVFGSVARGDVRPDSDIDVLIDFPADLERDAWDALEAACSRHGIRCDAHPRSWASDRFYERVVRDAVVVS